MAAPEWAGIVQTTIQKYIRGAEDSVMRNRKVPALLKSKGNVQYNQSGKSLEWRLRFLRQAMQGMGDGTTLTFARVNRWQTASLEWRGYAATDAEGKKERLMNKSAEAIINRYSEVTKLLLEDVEENFGDEFYVDGNLAGNELRVHGIESFMGTTGSAVSGSVAMAPSDTYAGLNTNLAGYGGTWGTGWPIGTGSAQYDFFAPLIVDYTSSLATASGGWASATATWAARCLEVVRYAIIHSMKNKSLKGLIDMVMLESELYRLFSEAVASKERVVVNRAEKKDGLTSLGFGDTINFEGCDVTFEYGMLANTGYGWNMDQIDLNSLQGTLFGPEGPDYDMASQTTRFSIDFYGNLRFRPRYFFKLGAFGSSGA